MGERTSLQGYSFPSSLTPCTISQTRRQNIVLFSIPLNIEFEHAVPVQDLQEIQRQFSTFIAWIFVLLTSPPFPVFLSSPACYRMIYLGLHLTASPTNNTQNNQCALEQNICRSFVTCYITYIHTIVTATRNCLISELSCHVNKSVYV
jgi:hypothetical protein